MRSHSSKSTPMMTSTPATPPSSTAPVGADPVAGAGDGDESGEESVRRVTGVPLLGHEVAVKDGGKARRAGGEGGVGGDAADADEVHGRECAAGIEAVPAEPEDQSAADGDGEIVRQHGSAAIALECAAEPWTENDGAGQGNESADGMYDSGTGEIMEANSERWEKVAGAAHVGKPAVRAPGPVSDDGVDETGDANAVEKVADESGAADHGA